MRPNLVEIIQDANGYSVTVTLANGFNECISGLYDLDDALNFAKMHLSYHDNKYVGRG